jgi:hypothetical protein
MQKVTEHIRIQAPARQQNIEGEYCQIIVLSVGDADTDREMCQLIQQCGGRK